MKIEMLAFKCIVPFCDRAADDQKRTMSTCCAHWGCCFVCGKLPDERHDDHTPENQAEVKRREEFDELLMRSLVVC